MFTWPKHFIKPLLLLALLTWAVSASEAGLCSRTPDKLNHLFEPSALRPFEQRREFAASKIGMLPSADPLHKTMAAGRRLPAEFEPQQALLIGGGALLNETPDLLLEIMQRTSGRIGQLVMISNDEEYKLVNLLIEDKNIDRDDLFFVDVTQDTMWVRDYGPVIVDCEGRGPVVMDASYDTDRPNDDFVPEALAQLLDLPVDNVPLKIDGGNLISNGSGLAIITTQIIDDNFALGYDESAVTDIMNRMYGVDQLVILEPLIGEGTGHVDMFATFTAPDTVVVGAYNRQYDPANAELLDRNASLLANTVFGNKTLKVVRIPMPPHENGIWRTYTNVIYANGIVLVPIYSSYDVAGRVRALNTFAKLMPRWEIYGIDSSRLIEYDGALHCISMNLAHVGERLQFSNGLKDKHSNSFCPKQQTWNHYSTPSQPFQPLQGMTTFIEGSDLYGVKRRSTMTPLLNMLIRDEISATSSPCPSPACPGFSETAH
jgi:agmatine deiminase